MTYNLADLFEQVVDAVPDREAFVVGDRRLTYGELDQRANRLAHVLAARGVGPGDRVGLQLLNGSEYLEGMLAAFKIRAVPINVNYRYVEGELTHLFSDADLVALILHASFADRVAAAAADLPELRTFLVVADGSDSSVLRNAIDYDTALAAASDVRDFEARSDDDLYCVYTGGTTGLPKGVLWRHEDIFFAAMGGGDPFQTGDWISKPAELVDRLPEVGMVALPIPPFMHASAHWLAFHQLFGGGKIVVTEGGGFDPAAIWDLVGREKVNTVVIVGDAMARPLCDELVAHHDRYDTSSLLAIGSGGAILSPSTKEQIGELLPGRFVVDSFGSSETGTVGGQGAFEGKAGAGPKLRVDERTAVLDDDLEPVAPGSEQVGRLARSGHVPIGYHGDEAKSAATFITHGDRRWVIPGDMATVEQDGTIVLLGRGSVSINTGGEKVFPEEVESALKAHPGVLDAVVVGVPDDRWGERVVAIVQARPGAAPSLADLQDHARSQIAGYKLPRDLVSVDQVVRSPSGKADYRWAKDVAMKSLTDGGTEDAAATVTNTGERGLKRLAGMDASFYYMETPNADMHVVGTLVLDPSDAPGGYSFAKVRHLMESRLHLLEPFRRRLVPVPFDLDHPVWIEDPEFDLDDHLHRIGVPAPGTMHELAEIVGNIAGRPLDRNRPLWEMWVVENMSEGRIAIVSKMHHTAMDGVTGADLMVHLFDLEAEAPDPEPPIEPWVPEALPSDNELVASALRARITDPLRGARALGRAGRSIVSAAWSMLPALTSRGDGMSMARPFSAPRTPFNGAVSRHRAVAFGEAPFADLRLIKTAFGTTVNDVVLAACASTMRSWLAAHGGVPEEPLVASIPVSVHVEGNTEVTNQVAAMLVELPTHLEDPVDQLAAVHAATVDAKEMQQAMGAGMLQDMAELMPGALFNRASRLYSSLRLAERHPPMHSLVISNIPGPPVPLYSAGARVLGVYPFGPLLEGAGLNITVLSNMGTMNFGVIADRDTVPDVWDIADGFGEAISALRKAAESKT